MLKIAMVLETQRGRANNKWLWLHRRDHISLGSEDPQREWHSKKFPKMKVNSWHRTYDRPYIIECV